MKKSFAAAALAACFALFAMFCNQPTQPTQIASATTSPDSLVKRGAYLVGMMGCTDCHSPKLMGPHGPYSDPDKLLSGHPAAMPIAQYDTATAKNWVLFNMMQTAIVGPWGTSFAANITSDSTGIGTWTEEQFFKAMREGKYKGLDNTRPILPPMPWQEYRNASDEDLKAIFAYLKSTKPVKNVVPTAIINMPPK